jgi:EAL domain-containing protein (putative c-di-GMP-specific phosphodiesterase class I)
MYADTGELYAAESLLRFTMPDGQMVSPVEFIPILEDTGLIIPVGKWILKKAIEMCKTVRQVYPEFRVSVNLSYIQILKSSITDEIYQQVDESGLDPESMIMELTESGHLENTPAVKRVWTHLKDYGVSIALDDFGTGYSNLQSIGNLTPNVVKLDRGFTVKALKNEYENLVMRYVIEMAHSLQLKICVEGIETQEELDRVRLLAPDYIQGYYYGKPCCKEEFLQKFVYVA